MQTSSRAWGASAGSRSGGMSVSGEDGGHDRHGDHGSDLAVREAWSPLFVRAKVPLVLAGHDHDYQRSNPQDGVTYVVSGGGAKLRDTGRESFTAVSQSVLHYVDLLVYPDRLVGRAIDQEGDLIDRWTIRRPGGRDPSG